MLTSRKRAKRRIKKTGYIREEHRSDALLLVANLLLQLLFTILIYPPVVKFIITNKWYQLNRTSVGLSFRGRGIHFLGVLKSNFNDESGPLAASAFGNFQVPLNLSFFVIWNIPDCKATPSFIIMNEMRKSFNGKQEHSSHPMQPQRNSSTRKSV